MRMMWNYCKLVWRTRESLVVSTTVSIPHKRCIIIPRHIISLHYPSELRAIAIAPQRCLSTMSAASGESKSFRVLRNSRVRWSSTASTEFIWKKFCGIRKLNFVSLFRNCIFVFSNESMSSSLIVYWNFLCECASACNYEIQ